MPLPESVRRRLDRLADDQRTAATAPPGPVLCVAPAGSGKTTTLVARIAWLVATGVAPDEITAVTFNRRAAVELSERLDAALDWLEEDADGSAAAPSSIGSATAVGRSRVRVRTFHALGLEILRSTGRSLPALVGRDAVLRSLRPDARRDELTFLDGALSRLKLDLDVDPAEIEADPDAGPVASTYVAYERTLAEAGSMDFDDLVRLSLRALESDPELLARWRRACGHLLVDETQDVDRAQLRLALLLAAPTNRIFLVGDDDQSIYGWRLADVRRVLGLAGDLPGLRRIDLEVNYRCPATVLERAVRLVEHNRERFAKAIRPGPKSDGALVLAPMAPDDEVRGGRLLDHWGEQSGTRAILARTNRELLPAAAVSLARNVSFRASALRLLIDEPAVDDLLAMVRTRTDAGQPLLVRIGQVRDELRLAVPATADARAQAAPGPGVDADVDEARDDDALSGGSDATTTRHDLAAALLGWAVRFPDLDALETAIRDARIRLAELQRDDALLTLATAHSTKGLEFDHVAVIGMDESRFPSARSVSEAAEPERALEEERRLAYVAWTRARASLTLVYDPTAPSRFLLEAFDASELGLPAVGS